MSSGTKVYDSINQPARFNAVLEAIAKTEKIMILSGSEVSVASGMPALTQTFAFSSNAFSSQMPLRAMITECSAQDRDLFQLAEDQLASYNKVMAARRIQARSAPANAFDQYFHQVLQKKHVVKYLTTSFDGLEANKKRSVEGKIVRMHGDNRFLRCSTPKCPGMTEKDTAGLDESLLSGATLLCAHCSEAAERPSTSRRPVLPLSSYSLRPAVQSSLGLDMLPGGKIRNKVVTAAKGADLLIIAGISLQSDEIMELVREISEEIHARYGGVVYIGSQPIRGRTTKYYVDFHLKMDVDECAKQILGVMDRLDSDAARS
ncbi:SIR2 family transcriptional regulator, partial [Rhizoctonia solani AG-3 Rhs1AP]